MSTDAVWAVVVVLTAMGFFCIGVLWERTGVWRAVKCFLGFHKWVYTPDGNQRRCLYSPCSCVQHKTWIVESELTGYMTPKWEKSP